VVIDPSRPPGDATCPRCGHLIWFPDETSPIAAFDRPTVDEDVGRAELALLLENALADVSEPAAEILGLYLIEGLTFEAIGQKAAMSRRSVRRVWARGLKELRRRLEQPA